MVDLVTRKRRIGEKSLKAEPQRTPVGVLGLMIVGVFVLILVTLGYGLDNGVGPFAPEPEPYSARTGGASGSGASGAADGTPDAEEVPPPVLEQIVPVAVWPRARLVDFAYDDDPIALMNEVRLISIQQRGRTRLAEIAVQADSNGQAGWRRHVLANGAPVPGTRYRVERVEELLVFLSHGGTAIEGLPDTRQIPLHRLIHPEQFEAVRMAWRFAELPAPTEPMIRLSMSPLWAPVAGSRYLAGLAFTHRDDDTAIPESEWRGVLVALQGLARTGYDFYSPDRVSRINAAFNQALIFTVRVIDPRSPGATTPPPTQTAPGTAD